AIGDILADGTAEKQHVLWHDSHLAADIGEWITCCLAAVKQDAATVWFIKLQYQGSDGGFARATWPYDGDFLTCVGLEGDVFQYRDFAARRIGKRYVFKSDVAIDRMSDGFFLFQ